jgi:vancomycin permeability regulator SanA
MIIRKRRWVLFMVGVVLLFFVAGSMAITLAGLHDHLGVADLAVVPGSMVYPNGTPSPALQSRLDQAAKLYRQGYFKLILVSGAHGREGYDEPVVMRHYLEVNGIPHDAIFEDNQGYRTWETARNTAAFLKAHRIASVLVVSQYFHILRCRLAFAKFGIAPVYTSHAPYWSLRDFYSLPREVVGCIGYSLYQAPSPQ